MVEDLVDDLFVNHDFKIAAVGINNARKNLLNRISTFGEDGVFKPDPLDLQETAQNVSDLYCKPSESSIIFNS